MNRFKKRLVLTRTGGTIIRIRRRRGTAWTRTTFDTAPELPAELAADAPETAEHLTETSAPTALEAEPAAQATEAAPQVAEAAAEATVGPAQATDAPVQVTDALVQATDERAQATGAPADPTPGLQLNQPFRDGLGVRGLRTTGLFAVPSDSVIQLVILISSFADQEQTANVWVRRVEEDELRTVFFRSLTVAAGGVQQVVVDGLGGQTIRIDVELPSDLLVPTASVTQYFLADGAIIVLVYKSPADFVPV